MNKRVNLIIIIFFLCTQSLWAQLWPSSDGWHSDISLYSWAVSQDGDIIVDGIKIPVEIITAEYFSNFVINGHMDVYNDRWLLILDIIYMNLDRIKETSQQGLDLTLFEALGGYRFTPEWEMIAGLRYFSFSNSFYSDEEGALSKNTGWVDPVIGMRYRYKLTRALTAATRISVGGLGLGSDLSYNLYAGLSWRFSNISLGGGYRIWSADYQKGSGSKKFGYDVKTSGIIVGMTFHLQ